MKRWLLVLAACGPEAPAPQTPRTPEQPPEDAAVMSFMPIDAAIDAPPEPEAPPAPPPPPEVWLKGSTHVHAKPSGDSSEPIDKVYEWYEQHGYDFIALTDHNKVTDPPPAPKLIVLPSIELTHNPMGCLPIGDKSRKCRIHVNVLGVTARPPGKIEWAERKSHERIDMYQAALREAQALGGQIVQINHPQWYWGMTGELLAELAHRGARLVEIENVQFDKWNVGDPQHPSMETIWDAALVKGETIWGVASDDAHDYEGKKRKWPPGGGWIVVKARRDARSILDALTAGHFYASTGVVLEHAEVDTGDLVVEVAPNESGSYAIEWIENGKVVETTHGRSGRRPVPAGGYVRAVVTRDDGKRAWVEPARR